MTEPKTRPTGENVEAFIDAIPDERRRADARTVCEVLARVTGEPAVMWGAAIVGFGQQHLIYDSGRELDCMIIGFSPRKASTTIYLSGGMDAYADPLARLGKHTTSGGCLHLKRADEVDPAVLEEILTRSVTHSRSANA